MGIVLLRWPKLSHYDDQIEKTQSQTNSKANGCGSRPPCSSTVPASRRPRAISDLLARTSSAYMVMNLVWSHNPDPSRSESVSPPKTSVVIRGVATMVHGSPTRYENLFVRAATTLRKIEARELITVLIQSECGASSRSSVASHRQRLQTPPLETAKTACMSRDWRRPFPDH